jgi:hypothetical protein
MVPVPSLRTICHFGSQGCSRPAQQSGMHLKSENCAREQMSCLSDELAAEMLYNGEDVGGSYHFICSY